jgi:hypothetical protein
MASTELIQEIRAYCLANADEEILQKSSYSIENYYKQNDFLWYFWCAL